MKNTITKKKYTDRKNLGGMIGTGLGAVGGAFLGNPVAGAQIGGQLGGLTQKAIEGPPKAEVKTDMYGYDQGFGYAGGGKLPTYSMQFGGPTDGPNWGEKGMISVDSPKKIPRTPYEELYKKDKLTSIGQDATRVKGPSHEEGGVDIGNNVEVEGQETMDVVAGSDYVFSKRVKIPGTYQTFAEVHEQMVKNNANPGDVENLAKLQEKITGRE